MTVWFSRMWWGLLLCFGLLTACVTVNVYFPAAAAEQAADTIIDDVWGEPGDAEQPETLPSANQEDPERRSLSARTVLDVFIPVAAAAPNLNVNTPAINKLKKSMGTRFQQLRPHFKSGAIGLTRDGMVAVRDLNAVPGNQRGKVKQGVAAENRDRKALYREIAKANGHPEWESNIRATFARQWINKAPPGYWVKQGGGWRRK